MFEVVSLRGYVISFKYYLHLSINNILFYSILFIKKCYIFSTLLFIKCIYNIQARDIYEEAIQTVTTVRDFTQVFDAYAQFEELSLKKLIEEAAKNPTEEGK